MANEGRLSIGLRIKKNNININPENISFNFDVVGDARYAASPTIGTSWELISFDSDFGTPGVALIRNTDDTNFVEIGKWDGATGQEFLKLLPGEAFPVRLAMLKSELAAKANTASVQIDIQCYEA